MFTPAYTTACHWHSFSLSLTNKFDGLIVLIYADSSPVNESESKIINDPSAIPIHKADGTAYNGSA